VANTVKKLIIVAIIITILFVSVGVSTQVALAAAHPLRPGDIMFPIQNLAEQLRVKFTIGGLDQAVYHIELANHRADDLLVLAGDENVDLVLNFLVHALDQLEKSVTGLSSEQATTLLDGLQKLVLKTSMLVTYLEANSDLQPGSIVLLQDQVNSITGLLSDISGKDQVVFGAEIDQMINALENQDSEVDSIGTEVPAHNIQFPPGSPGAEHAFFILDGAHAELECVDCHLDGQYAGTPNLCIDCHTEQLPINHFSGDCSSCHLTTSWQEVNFDHTALDTSDCQSCHLVDAPQGHYAAQCSACHNTENWQQATFDHRVVNTKDCSSCHANDKPSNHYQAQCSACHNTSNWAQVDFNHQAVGATDCKACHSGKKPANHYAGQCSACHNTTNWSQANFNHQAVGATDCKACHSGRKPANHYGGQCSACHNTSQWSGAQFNHGAAGATDCKACHSNRKPANHYGGQCSACHSTSQWSGAKFNHAAAGATDCKACHSGRKPANHFDGQCSQCHTTSSWGGASFNHKFPMNHGNANGKCSSCHPSGGSSYNCFACHDKAKMTEKHNEEGISDFASRCLACHPGGREGDDD
jgi:hypothetical protein